MSELKARRAYFSEDEYDRGTHKICAKVSDCGSDRRNDWWSYALEDDVYLKSEADAVIADLEENYKMEVEQLLIEIVELKADYKEACDRLQTANLIKDEQIAATRHQKYKRCLAMAKLCVNGEIKLKRVKMHDMNNHQFWQFDNDYWQRWNERWLKIAEKFKDKE